MPQEPNIASEHPLYCAIEPNLHMQSVSRPHIVTALTTPQTEVRGSGTHYV